nr:hypothetical protein [Tanacetum cinerariifolium]
MTDLKLARDFHTSSYDQLYAYLEQHEAHANQARLMREIFPDPLALVANYHYTPSQFNNYHSQYTTPQFQKQFSPPAQQLYSSTPQSNPYGAPHQQQKYPNAYPTNLSHTPSSIPQNAYPSLIISQQPQADFPQLDSSLAILTFLPELLLIYETMLPFKMAGVLCNKFKEVRFRMLLCTQSKRKKDATWFKEKVLLVQAQAEGQVLDEEKLAFLTDPRVANSQVAQPTITHSASF